MRRLRGAYVLVSCITLLNSGLPANAWENPYGVAGYISSTNLANHGFPPGMDTYDWNNLRTDLAYQMVRPFHYWYRYMVPGGNYVVDWMEHDAPNQPQAWFTQESYETDTPWNVRRGFNMMLQRPWGYFLDRTGGNTTGQIGLPPSWLPQWYVDQGGNHQQRFDAWITANPGRIWLIGNEPGCFEYVWQLKGQDALTDREYAEFYHIYRSHIVALDPGAKFANGAQAMTTSPTWSPELTVESVIAIWERVLDHYLALYGQEMPVDIWNIHLYAGHGCTNMETHRAEFVLTIETFRNYVDTARGGIYQGAPMILTEFNGQCPAGFTRENAVNFLNAFREDLHSMWVRGVLDQWFWFVSNGGTIWPDVSILEGGSLTIVGEAYRDAAWSWEELKPPLHEQYGTAGQPFHSHNGGLWSLVTWSDGAGDNQLSVNESFVDRARITVDPGTGTAAERTLADERHLGDLGTFAFLEGYGAGVKLRIQSADADDHDFFLGYLYGEDGPDDGQSGVILRAVDGDASDITVLDAFNGQSLATGMDFTQTHKLFFVVSATGDMELYLDDTTTPLAVLSRMSLPDTDANQLRFGSNSAEVSGHGRFQGEVEVFAYAVDEAILDSEFARTPPVIVDADLSAKNLLANDIATYTTSITVLDYNGVDDIRDVRLVFHSADALAPANGRGYLVWGATDAEITHGDGQWHLAGDADGGGRWGWRTDDWGSDQFVTPLSAATATSGNQRTVTFTFRVKAPWATAHQQRLYASARDNLEPVAEWTLLPDRYAVLRIDLDGDGDIDMDDFGYLQACFSGSGVAQTDPACSDALLDDDNDVDAEDLLIFRKCMSGPDIPAAPDCAD